MPTKNVSLSPQQAKFVRQSIKDGGFRNASEVLRAGLRLLEQRQKADELKLAALRKMCKEGFDQIDQGKYELVDPNDLEAFLDRLSPSRSSKKTK
jgi:antitoxin ParD1/3/4